MRKYLFICLMAVAAMSFTACNNNEPQMRKRTVDLIVRTNDWGFDKSTNQYFCHIDVPELTERVYNYGEVSVNHEYNSGTKNAYQVALPETSYKVEYETDANDSIINTFNYAEHIDYIYSVGFVEVFYTISDYFYPEGFVPEGMLFRLQMTY